MTKGNTRTVMLLLLAGAAVSLLGAPQAAATDMGKETNATLTQMFDPKAQYDKIPDDILLDRNDAEWTSQKEDDVEFENKQEAIKAFVSYDTEKNGWNEAMKKTVLVTHNFDVMSGEAGNGFELVALSKALDRLQGVYTASDPEKRFHDWAMAKYDIPDSAGDIDARIDEIKSELGPDLVSQAIAAFDEQARHGNVPRDLMANDTAFWAVTAAIALCEHDLDCDPAFMKKVRDEKIYEEELPYTAPVTETAHPITEYFLPMAHAATVSVEHVTSMLVRVIDCNYGSCSLAKHGTTTGAYIINFQPPMIRTPVGEELGHAEGGTVPAILVSSCGTSGDPNINNYLRAQFSTASVHWADHDARRGCAYLSAHNVHISHNDDAHWTWTLSGASYASLRTR